MALLTRSIALLNANGLEISSIAFDTSMTTIKVEGSEEFIVSIAQQLAWLAALCQEKGNNLTYAYVAFKETYQATPDIPKFNIAVKLDAVPPDNGNGCCWTNLIGPAILIQGYPIPDRKHGERGLEVDVSVMAAISGMHKAVTFRGGFVFKERCHALVPVKRIGSSIQWHVLDTYPRRLEWEEIETACPTRIRGELMIEDLKKCRSFFGWCPQILELLGKSYLPSSCSPE